ncbi:hypothetical protein GCM10009623_33480 [Nocardioides aestuarii]|uniref:Integral membrane protein n=1 Tax=Nocardioides aestuarii TaxID=252231 RepID=A0ABW4TRE3_9ACTN
MTLFAWSLAAALVLLAVAAAVSTRVTSLDRPVRLATYAAEGVVVFFVVADLGLLLRAGSADRPDSMVTHLGYALAAVGLVPALTMRPNAVDDAPEPEPVSGWVVAVALLAVAVCVVRLVQTR